jgi:hypothetical protein
MNRILIPRFGGYCDEQCWPRLALVTVFVFLTSIVPAQPSYAQTAPTLTIANTALVVTNNKVTLPVTLTTNGNSLGAVALSLDINTTCLTFDPTDDDANGVPDALSNTPLGFAVSAFYNNTDSDGELDLSFYDVSLPIASLPNGLLLNIAFDIASGCNPTNISRVNTVVAFSTSPAVTFGNTTGGRVEGTATGATVPLNFHLAPTNIILTGSSIAENQPANLQVGTLTSTDPNSADSHSYSLVAGIGDTDNSAFTVDSAKLRAVNSFNYEVKDSYSVRIRTTDSGGLQWEKSFPISVINVNEQPTALDDFVTSATQVFFGSGGTINVLRNDTDPDASTTLAISAIGPASLGSASISANLVSFDPPDSSNGVATFPYTASDNDATIPLTDEALVTVTYVANHARGDCNGDGIVEAADFVAVVLELFDTSTDPWHEIYNGDYAGSPRGCDVNGNLDVQSSDIICTVLIVFGEECGDSSVAAKELAEPPTLETTTSATDDDYMVKIRLRRNNSSLAATAFTLIYNPTQLTLDSTDGDSNGIPDAVEVSIPARAQAWVDAKEGVIKIAVSMISLPVTPLPDGDLVRIKFAHNGESQPTLQLRDVSSGNTSGSAMNLDVTGSVPFQQTDLFLPRLNR